MKVWCSNCYYEGEGELEDASYLDEDRGWVSGETFTCPKCGFTTGGGAVEEHFAVNKEVSGESKQEEKKEAETT